MGVELGLGVVLLLLQLTIAILKTSITISDLIFVMFESLGYTKCRLVLFISDTQEWVY